MAAKAAEAAETLEQLVSPTDVLNADDREFKSNAGQNSQVSEGKKKERRHHQKRSDIVSQAVAEQSLPPPPTDDVHAAGTTA